MFGDQSDEVVEEFAPRPIRQLVLFGQACGELVKRNRNIVSPGASGDDARPKPAGFYPSPRPQNVARCRDRNLQLRVRRNL
jgi:hypothetical protein